MSTQERFRITTLVMEANLNPNLAPKLADHLEIEDYGGLTRTLISSGSNPELIVKISNELDNATLVVDALLAGCVICVALEPKDPNIRGNIPGTNLVDPYTIELEHRGEIRDKYNLVFSRPIPPKGELHSDHLYWAGLCIGAAGFVDKKLVDEVVGRLLLEFDLEAHPPYRAIETFAAMGEIGVQPLLNYVKDQTKDTFSREDAAIALGTIGTDAVVAEVGSWLDEISIEDAAMPLYTLGNTKNIGAKSVIEDWMGRNKSHSKYRVAEEALARLMAG